MLASLVSRMISRPLYDTLAEHMVGRAISSTVPTVHQDSGSTRPSSP
jgi:hypothetical protein